MSTERNNISEINVVIAKYNEELLNYGVRCTVSQKHFQIHLSHEPHTNANAGAFALLDRAMYKFRLNFLPFKDDDYKCVVIRFEPITTSIKKTEIREFAFIKSYREDINKSVNNWPRLPKEVEKLIVRTIKKLRKSSADKVCKDSAFDILRYTTQIKYSYKKQVLGYDKNILDTVISITFILLFILCIAILILMLF